jgi:hypothetical protein
MTTKRVQMEKRMPRLNSEAGGMARRRPQRRRILGLLREICLKLERLQHSEDARLACREVARILGEARMREGGERGISKKV